MDGSTKVIQYTQTTEVGTLGLDFGNRTPLWTPYPVDSPPLWTPPLLTPIGSLYDLFRLITVLFYNAQLAYTMNP